MFYQFKFIYRFKSRDIDNFGVFVTSINGLESDPAALTAWVPFLFSGGQLTEGNKIFLSAGVGVCVCVGGGGGCRTIYMPISTEGSGMLTTTPKTSSSV